MSAGESRTASPVDVEVVGALRQVWAAVRPLTVTYRRCPDTPAITARWAAVTASLRVCRRLAARPGGARLLPQAHARLEAALDAAPRFPLRTREAGDPAAEQRADQQWDALASARALLGDTLLRAVPA
jgi:hypothetical protein